MTTKKIMTDQSGITMAEILMATGLFVMLAYLAFHTLSGTIGILRAGITSLSARLTKRMFLNQLEKEISEATVIDDIRSSKEEEMDEEAVDKGRFQGESMIRFYNLYSSELDTVPGTNDKIRLAELIEYQWDGEQLYRWISQWNWKDVFGMEEDNDGIDEDGSLVGGKDQIPAREYCRDLGRMVNGSMESWQTDAPDDNSLPDDFDYFKHYQGESDFEPVQIMNIHLLGMKFQAFSNFTGRILDLSMGYGGHDDEIARRWYFKLTNYVEVRMAYKHMKLRRKKGVVELIGGARYDRLVVVLKNFRPSNMCW